MVTECTLQNWYTNNNLYNIHLLRQPSEQVPEQLFTHSLTRYPYGDHILTYNYV